MKSIASFVCVLNSVLPAAAASLAVEDKPKAMSLRASDAGTAVHNSVSMITESKYLQQEEQSVMSETKRFFRVMHENATVDFETFMPLCIAHSKLVCKRVDLSYTDAMLENVLENECLLEKEFPLAYSTGFNKWKVHHKPGLLQVLMDHVTKHHRFDGDDDDDPARKTLIACRKFAVLLTDARYEELDTPDHSTRGYRTFCEAYFEYWYSETVKEEQILEVKQEEEPVIIAPEGSGASEFSYFFWILLYLLILLCCCCGCWFYTRRKDKTTKDDKDKKVVKHANTVA